jgi:hypothetical protein
LAGLGWYGNLKIVAGDAVADTLPTARKIDVMNIGKSRLLLNDAGFSATSCLSRG